MTVDRPHVANLSLSDPSRPQPGRANDEEADRSENAVLTAYLSHLTSQGHQVQRHRVVTDPVLESTDLFDATAHELVMACHRTHYLALISALGVLSDCARFFGPTRRALLLTAVPSPAAREFLSHHGIVAIWPEGESFARADPAAEADRA
ncbi:hypothetical protein [Streptomyces sp. 900105245]